MSTSPTVPTSADEGTRRSVITGSLSKPAHQWNGRITRTGDACVAPTIAMKLTPHELDSLARQFRLSPRETQVLGLLLEGVATNPEMAERLATTPGAIQAAVQMLMAKTGTRSRHELVTRTLKCLLDREVEEMRSRMRRAMSEGLASLQKAIRNESLGAALEERLRSEMAELEARVLAQMERARRGEK